MMGFEEIKTNSYTIADWKEYDSYTGKIEYVATTMAYNPLRDEVYGCFINEERTGYNLVRWNYTRYLPAAVIAPLERPWSGCAFASDGTLYAIERNGDLYTVDTRTGAMTLVGQTGLSSTYLSDATIDTATDTMYWCVSSDDEVALYTVDLATATTTKLYDLVNEEQLCSMYVPVTVETPAGAPARISSVSANFSGTSKSGKISFYSPGTSTDGNKLPAEVNLTYTVKANGKTIATGECLPGKRTEVPVEMTETDNYYFSVTTANEAGESPECGTHKYVGPDTPKAPTMFQTTISGNTVNLQWNTPSSTGVNGGNVNYSAATYTVVRYPDKKVLAENVSDRKLTDELPSPEVRTDYYYVLSTSVEGLSAPDVKSGTIALGPIMPPYTGEFKASTDMAGWTVIDANEDNTLWKYSSYDKAVQLYGSKGFNDWLITPAVKVKATSSYPFTITLSASNYYEETFEVMWGTEPTAEAMVNTLIPATAIKGNTNQTFNGELSVTDAGTIYIGIHGATTGKSNTLNVKGFTIESGQTANAPAAPANFKAETPVDGSRKAVITFNNPSTTLAGEPLEGESALTRVEIYRDDKTIHTITEGLEPGAEVTYTDEADDLTFGNHSYSAVAFNAYGDGAVAITEVLVGARKPVAPESATFIEEGNTGKVTISWDEVTTDIEGNTISSDAVSYKVIDREYNVIASDVKETSITFTAVPEGEQAFVQFGVYAVTAGGESDKMAATAYKPAGEPYATPWSESFRGKQVSSIFGYNYIKGQEPWQFISSYEWGIAPQDEDGGFALFEAYGDLTALVTGKIDLTGLENPSFVYYTYNYSSGNTYDNALEVQVDNGEGNGFVPVQKTVVAQTGPTNQWNKVVVSLAEYEGQSVVIRIEPQDPGLAIYTLDNMRVTSYVENNLSASALSAPAVADIDKPVEVTATVSNTGENPIQSYTVELYNGDEMIDYRECTRLEPGELKNVTFEATFNVAHGDEAILHAEIICSDDQIESDNISETVTVGIMPATVPHVTDLAASATNNGVELTWSTPDLSSAAPEPFTETFEGAGSWGNTVDGWKFVDKDMTPLGGIQLTNFPATGLQSWFIADKLWEGFNENTVAAWNAHSGNKYMASGYVLRGGEHAQSDDWAISPRLFNCVQTISFYAKSFDPSFPESLEVLASTGTSDVDDFVSVAKVSDLSSSWQMFRFKLPEGTKYAAIRSRSYNKFFLFVDDVTFIPADGTPAQLTLAGFHVYRNGTRITSEPVAEPFFTDTNATPDYDHTYFVTAVYDKGESRQSNKVGVSLTGISGVAGADGVSVKALRGGIEVTGLSEGTVAVTATDGRIVAMAEAQPVVRVALPAGIYIVSAGNTTAKVIVK